MPTINPVDRSGSAFLLLDYEWLPRIEGPLRTALSEFAETAFLYDQEAGFSNIVEFRRDHSDAEPRQQDIDTNRHLVAYATEDDGAGEERRGARDIVAYLSITGVDENGCGAAILVVAPQFRSRGIATLLAERLAAEAPDPFNWFGTGLTRLAFEAAGPHPAAQRLARRMNVLVAGERSLLIRSLRGPVARPELFNGPTVTVEADEQDPDRPEQRHEHTYELLKKHPQFARAVKVVRRRYWLPDGPLVEAIVRYSVFEDARVSRLAFIEFTGQIATAPDAAIGALIDAAAGDLWTAGVKAVLASIDGGNEALVQATRKRYFQHDQTDLTYIVDLA